MTRWKKFIRGCEPRGRDSLRPRAGALPGAARLSRLALAVILLPFLLALTDAHAQGRLLPPQSISSAVLGTNRTIRIYLPPSYDREPNRRYPVLYLHDGQNVFSSAGTNCCFGWGSWELDKTVDALCHDGKIREIIMVGVDSTTNRMKEYSGRVIHTGENKFPGDPRGDFENYARFLIHELKPKIDREYRTLQDPAHTGAMGSSLGGLCSAALAWHHPETFGLAASLSGAFQVDETNFLTHVLPVAPAHKNRFRVYVDSGGADFTGGDDNRALSFQVATELRRLAGPNAVEYYLDAAPMTEAQLEKAGLRRDKWREAQTSQHNEFYWRQRAWRPLVFLFPPE